MTDEVVLTLPANPELVSLARMLAAGLASRSGFSFEEVEDLRLAIDELCFSLVGAGGRSGAMVLKYLLSDASLEVEGTLSDSQRPLSLFSTEYSERILDALVDDHGTSDADPKLLKAWLRKTRLDDRQGRDG